MLVKILNYLKKYEEATAGQIAASCGIDSAMAQAGLEELAAKGLVERGKPDTASCGCCGPACKRLTSGNPEVFRIIKGGRAAS